MESNKKIRSDYFRETRTKHCFLYIIRNVKSSDNLMSFRYSLDSFVWKIFFLRHKWIVLPISLLFSKSLLKIHNIHCFQASCNFVKKKNSRDVTFAEALWKIKFISTKNSQFFTFEEYFDPKNSFSEEFEIDISSLSKLFIKEHRYFEYAIDDQLFQKISSLKNSKSMYLL